MLRDDDKRIYRIVTLWHSTAFYPYICAYAPIEGDTPALGIWNGYKTWRGEFRYVLFWEIDDDEYDWQSLTVKPYVVAVVETKRGFHIYTDRVYKTKVVLMTVLKGLYEKGLVDEGFYKLSKWRYEHGYKFTSILRIAGKYRQKDMKVLYEREWNNRWWRKVKEVHWAWSSI